MARVIVSAYSNVSWTVTPYHDAYVTGFAAALKRCGNDVLMIRNNDFVLTQLLHEPRPQLNFDGLTDDLSGFQPDLILTFNNSLPHPDLVRKTNCPVLVYPSDAPCYYTFRELIEEFQERYYFLHTNDQVTQALMKEFPFLDVNQNIEFGYATEVWAADGEQDIDISFIGSIGNYSSGLADYFSRPMPEPESESADADHTASNRIKKDFFRSLDHFVHNSMNRFDFSFPGMPKISESIEATMVHVLTCKNRFEILSELTDLNLKIFGYPESWAETITYNHSLFRCFDYEQIVTLEQNSGIHNRSKICLHLPHGFSIEGLSWRVCDIMASNGLLLSPWKGDLKKLIQNHIDLPMYKNKYEARDLANRLLQDELWRAELVAGCQAVIDEYCRFDQKFQTINRYFPTFSLSPDTPGSLTHIQPNNYWHFTLEHPFLESSYNRLCGSLRELIVSGRVKTWDKVLVYGTWEWARKITNVLEMNGIQVFAFLDSHENKWGQTFMSREVLNPAHAETRIPGCKVIIGSSALQPISQRLDELGFIMNRNYFVLDAVC